MMKRPRILPLRNPVRYEPDVLKEHMLAQAQVGLLPVARIDLEGIKEYCQQVLILRRSSALVPGVHRRNTLMLRRPS